MKVTWCKNQSTWRLCLLQYSSQSNNGWWPAVGAGTQIGRICTVISFINTKNLIYFAVLWIGIVLMPIRTRILSDADTDPDPVRILDSIEFLWKEVFICLVLIPVGSGLACPGSRTRSGKMMRIRHDPDPQNWCFGWKSNPKQISNPYPTLWRLKKGSVPINRSVTDNLSAYSIKYCHLVIFCKSTVHM